MKINNLLKGRDNEAQKQLDKLFDSIGYNPNICWYPSADNDYRNVMELSSQRSVYNGIKELPDIFFHTAYNKHNIKTEGIVYEDKYTKVTITNSYNLSLKEDILFFVNEDYVTHPAYAPSKPEVYLFDLQINSDKYGEIVKPVIYFLFENINFLEEILFRYNIKVSHLVKVRDGSGSGGGKIGMDILFFFFSKLETKYLICDSQVNYDLETINRIRNSHKLELLDYELGLLNILPNKWSERESLKSFSIRTINQSLNSDKFKDNLKRIKSVNEIDRLKISEF